MTDGMEQKIDKLIVMMGKLVTDDENRINHSNHKFINLREVGVRLDVIMIREDIKAGLGQTMSTENIQDIAKIIEAGQDMITIIEVVTSIVSEITKGTVDLMIIK